MKGTLLLITALLICGCGSKKKAADAEYWRMIAEYRKGLEEEKRVKDSISQVVAMQRFVDSLQDNPRKIVIIDRVEGYIVTGDSYPWINPGEDYIDVTHSVDWIFTNPANGKSFSVHGSYYETYYKRADATKYIKYTAPEIRSNTIIPMECPFFFADLNFDGKKEIIAGHSWGRGQYSVGQFTSIYSIDNDRAIEWDLDKKGYERLKERMDEYYFGVNPIAKEIMFVLKGSASDYEKQVYKYDSANDRYYLARTVDFSWASNYVAIDGKIVEATDENYSEERDNVCNVVIKYTDGRPDKTTQIIGFYDSKQFWTL